MHRVEAIESAELAVRENLKEYLLEGEEVRVEIRIVNPDSKGISNKVASTELTEEDWAKINEIPFTDKEWAVIREILANPEKRAPYSLVNTINLKFSTYSPGFRIKNFKNLGDADTKRIVKG